MVKSRSQHEFGKAQNTIESAQRYHCASLADEE